MPFLGQDWRSPGWRWIKTEDGWKRCEPSSSELEEENNRLNDISHAVILDNDEEIYNADCEFASKKRKKDHFRNNAKSQYFYGEKWIYVHKESTKERHGYCTLGEAFNRLDFSSAIQDIRRFNYVVKLLQLIAKSQLTSLSGAAQKNYFNILDKIVQKVLEDQYNPRLIKDLLQDLSSTLCTLIRGVGKSVLVGNINIWICRLETILLWQQQLSNLQMTKFCRHLILSEKGHIDWKLMYFALQKCYPIKEQYGDTLHFCRHCSILFWKDYHLALLLKDTGHPCTANDPNSCFMPVSPQHFIDLFKF
ncbi:F-box only protein 25 isoform X5 [Anolis carolinensis]|uniref:F-box only protein 25 isoform X5 n=1 Tax=Anolis carolinensis TaxID=28377 RepID=UPI002F2B469C